MQTNHALYGLDPAVVHMAIKAPEHAPAELKARIALAAKRAKEGKTFAAMPMLLPPIRPVKCKRISVSYKVPKQVVTYTYSYSIKNIWNDGRPTLQQIIKEVAERYGITVDDIKSARRNRAITIPRLEFYYRARTETLNSYPSIARFCGNRDHTTVISGAIKYARTNGKELPESNYGAAA